MNAFERIGRRPEGRGPLRYAAQGENSQHVQLADTATESYVRSPYRERSMPITRPILRVFLSSPGDVDAQREIVRETLDRQSNDPLIGERCVLRVVGWDTAGANVPLDAGKTPQVSVNQYIPLPRECDLTIVILWSRLGTPLPAEIRAADGSLYRSGTLWEYADAVCAGKPVWLYKKTDIPRVEVTDPDLDRRRRELQEVEDFVASSRDKDGSLRFGLHEFDDDEELRAMLTAHVRNFVRCFFAETSPEPCAQVAVPRVERDPALAAVLNAGNWRELNAPEVALTTALLPLARYPIGPMIKDIAVRHLAEAVADLQDADDVRSTLGEINASLRAAATIEDPELRLSRVMFSTALGSKHFWEDVLHHAAVQGPRMLSAVLQVIDTRKLDERAAGEFQRLVRRVNSYV